MKTYNVVTVNENSKTIIRYETGLSRSTAYNRTQASRHLNKSLKIISDKQLELHRANGWRVA